jgi:two-component system OmpR family sensor kinase
VSLRTRLLIASGLVALIALVVADIATYSAISSFLYNRIDDTLQSAFAAPGPGPGPGYHGNGAPPAVPPAAPGLFVERRTADGSVEFTYGAYEPGGKRYTPSLPASVFAGPSDVGHRTFFNAESTQPGGPDFRVLVTVEPDGDRLVVAEPLDATNATLHHLMRVELAVTAAALLTAVVIGAWLVRIGLRPLAKVEETAEAIADGEMDRRVPGEERRTEVGRLARVLNVMLARIQRAFAERDATERQLRASEERLRRFVADASHELRTPLAAVSAYAELYDRGGADHPEDLERIIHGIQGESARMARLVEDLLLLARLDEGLPIEHEPVELVGVAAEAVRAAAAVGPEWPTALEAPHPMEVLGDRGRLRQVLDNLLANVRAHTPAGTPATVRLLRQDQRVLVEVGDRGPGLSAEAASRIFERFYRADPSRARSSGGAGLGLSIVAAIVTAHGGTTSAAPGPDGGAVFTVSLPAIDDQVEADDSSPDDAAGTFTAEPQVRSTGL